MASHKATHGQDEKVISGKPPSVTESDYLKEYDIPARPRVMKPNGFCMF